MISFRALYFFIFVFLTVSLYSQNDNLDDPLTNSVSEYFKYDREIIHLHLNKETYFSDEFVWFKGYITEKKTGSPYGNTVNAYVQLLDESGKQLKLTLHFAENSTFQGRIDLPDNLHTGTYFIRAYSYFMNNFSEDESTVYRISIINKADEKVLNTKKINYASAEIELYPESGVFLQGIQNTIAVKITDCNENGIAVSNIFIEDSKANHIVSFTTNNSGYGRFELSPKPFEIYKAVFELDGKKYEKQLPTSSVSGIALTVNNYAFADKTVLQAKTNATSLVTYSDKLIIVMQNRFAVQQIPLVFKTNNLEATIVIPTNQFESGITTFYIVDSNQNKLAERVAFMPSSSIPKIDVAIRESRGDSIVLSGVASLKLANFSISVLPASTITQSAERSIIGTMLFDNVLSSPVKNAAFYINNQNRKTRYELDNILITKESKYKWNTISSETKSTIKYPFESGLSIKGTVNVGTANKKDLRIKMTQFAGDQIVPLNDKNEFFFNHLAAVDSTRIHFSLLRREKSAPLKMYPQLVNGNRTFNKQLSYGMRFCTILEDSQEADFPAVSGTIVLKGVEIEGVKSDALVHERRYGNAMSRGYKISNDDATSYSDVASFIQAHGYNVSNIGTELTISNRVSTSFTGSNSPEIFMDDAPILDISILRGFSLRDVEEIYINKRGYGGGSSGANGIIRIYTKKVRSHNPNITVTSQSFLVIDGFQKWYNYELPKYENVRSQEFYNFGTIHWIPNVNTDEQGNFSFAFPHLYQKSVKLHIEGIASDGQTISKIINLDLK